MGDDTTSTEIGRRLVRLQARPCRRVPFTSLRAELPPTGLAAPMQHI